jgi:hypothetical protein
MEQTAELEGQHEPVRQNGANVTPNPPDAQSVGTETQPNRELKARPVANEEDEQVIMDTRLARSLAAGVPPLDEDEYSPFPYGAPYLRRQQVREQWHRSTAFKQARGRSNIGNWVGLTSLVLGACAATLLGVAGFDGKWPMAIGICSFIIGIAAILWSAYNMHSAFNEYEPDRGQLSSESAAIADSTRERRWLTDPNLQNLITLNRKQMKVYHELATEQAKRASRNSRLAMSV